MNPADSCTCERLLEKHHDGDGHVWLEPQATERCGRARRGLAWNIALYSTAILLLYNAVITTVYVFDQPANSSPAYSPANVGLRHEIIDAWDEGQGSPWLHGTQEETDEAWLQLMTGLNVRIKEEEMYKSQSDFDGVEDAMRVSDGDYVGILGVYHSLHCLYMLRVAVNQDAYNISDKERAESLKPHHYQHCIDFLRDDVMCHADLTIYRATWVQDPQPGDLNIARSTSQRQCASWGSLWPWIQERKLAPGQFNVRPSPY